MREGCDAREGLPPPVSQPSFLTALFIAHIKLPIKSAPTDLARNCYVLESTQATAIMKIYTVQKGIKINPIVLLNPFHLPITTTKTQSSFPTAVLASAQK